jgi:hypothetical protein
MAEVRPVYLDDSEGGFPAEVLDTDSIRAGGAAFVGEVTMATNKITGLGDPTAAQDAATKQYVDSIAAGLELKDACRVATDAALPANTAAGSGVGKTLTADAVGILTVDGVNTVLGDRILVKDESAGADVDHGIYEVTTEGTAGVAFVLTRATDFDGSPAGEVVKGAFTFIQEGTANDKTGWAVLTDDPITVDTTAIEFTQFQGLPQFIGGDGIDITGDTISVDLATNPGLEFATGELRVDVADTNELSLSAAGLNVEGVPTLFNIGATAVGATVTAPNLDTLTDGSNADALHTHAAIGNPQETTDGVGVTIGDPVYYSANDIVSAADAANANATKVSGLADATVGASAAVGLATEGDAVVPASIGGAPSAGDLVYLANGGGVTVTQPATTGDRLVVVGKMKNATTVRVGPGQYLGRVA